MEVCLRMKGSYHVRVRSNFVSYEFDIRRNLTIIQGDSATGKTTLIDMLREHQTLGADSGIELNCERPCQVIEGIQWKDLLSIVKEDSIIFIDEGNRFTESEDFARTVQGSRHYFVIVTREPLYNLPYSVTEIYGIRSSGRYSHLHPVYHEFYPIYTKGLKADAQQSGIQKVITEDSNSGYEFFQAEVPDGIQCLKGGGNTALFEMMKAQTDNTLVIADGAAFGPNMKRTVNWIRNHSNISLYLPESFEWLILRSGLVDGNRVKEILDQPADYIESEQYVSWERFFTKLLADETAGTYLQYRKSSLNKSYLHKQNAEKIIKAMPVEIQHLLGHGEESGSNQVGDN